MKELLCKIFGHKWLYNFKSMPNKAICSRCKLKHEWDFNTYEWIKADFSHLGADAELIKRWHKL